MKEHSKYENAGLIVRQRQLTELLRSPSTLLEVREQAHRELRDIFSQLEKVTAAEKDRLPSLMR